MKLQLKLNPALRRPELAPGDRRLWFLGAIALRREQRAVPVWTFEVFWKRLFAGFAAAVVALYLVAVTALWFWLDRVPQNEVSWGTLATAPVRWQHFREKRGDTAIAVALERLKERDYVEAYYGLRVGLPRSPGNVRGRLALAGMLAGNDPAQTLTLLEAGLDHSADNPEFLRALFSVYQMQQARERALEKSQMLLERQPSLSPEARLVVAMMRAAYLNEAGDYEGALALVSQLPTASNARDSARLTQLRVELLARLGRLPEARALLAEFAKAPPTFELFRAQAELALAEGDQPAVEGALRRMKGAAGDQPHAHIYAFQAWHRLKRWTLRDQAEQEFYRGFGGSDAALQMLAATAVNLGLSEVVQRAMQVAIANRLSPFAFRVHLTELALRRGDFDAAFRQLRDWERLVETLKPAQRNYPEFINRLTRASVAGGEQQLSALASHLGTMRGRATSGMYRLATDVLERAGQPESARQVVQLGLRLYPQSDVLRATDQRVTQQLAAIAKAGERPAAAAETTVALPNTGDATLQLLDGHLAQESLTAARTLVRAIRTVSPAWLPRFEAELALRETHLALLTQDALTARTIVRTHLDRYRSDDDAVRLVRLAGALAEKKHGTEARIIHDEVTALRGTAPAVARALRALNFADDLAAAATTQAAALAEIDRALEQNQPAEALRIFDYLKQKAPAWYAGAQTELSLREVRMRLALDQRPLALAAWKNLVVRSGLPRAAAFKFVRELHANGDDERALLLAREIVKLLPGDAAAGKLLKEAEAPSPVN
ncbi:MAG: hypothetical protein C0518_13105 [Opitutus sp.]|nr:hypothetical protein [Opitutus sp.]